MKKKTRPKQSFASIMTEHPKKFGFAEKGFPSKKLKPGFSQCDSGALLMHHSVSNIIYTA